MKSKRSYALISLGGLLSIALASCGNLNQTKSNDTQAAAPVATASPAAVNSAAMLSSAPATVLARATVSKDGKSLEVSTVTLNKKIAPKSSTELGQLFAEGKAVKERKATESYEEMNTQGLLSLFLPFMGSMLGGNGLANGGLLGGQSGSGLFGIIQSLFSSQTPMLYQPGFAGQYSGQMYGNQYGTPYGNQMQSQQYPYNTQQGFNGYTVPYVQNGYTGLNGQVYNGQYVNNGQYGTQNYGTQNYGAQNGFNGQQQYAPDSPFYSWYGLQQNAQPQPYTNNGTQNPLYGISR